MAWKTAIENEMIIKILNQHQHTVPHAVQKAATLDDKVGEISNRKRVNGHDNAKLYSHILQKYMTVNEQITHTENLSQIVAQPTPSSMYNDEFILETGPKNTRHEMEHVTFP